MRKQKDNPAWAAVAGWIGRKDHNQANSTRVQAQTVPSFEIVNSLYKAFQKAIMQLAQWKGQVVSVDEIIRRDAKIPSFNFIGAPFAFLLLDSRQVAPYINTAQNKCPEGSAPNAG